MKKRVLSAVLSILLVFSLIPTAFAEDAAEDTALPQASEEPAPTETPLPAEEPTPTPEPTPEPTVEPTPELTVEPTPTLEPAAEPDYIMRTEPAFSGGDGTAANPFGISTPEQLNAVRNYPSSYFILLNDIDLTAATRSGGSFYNGGKGWIPIGDYSGNFKGVFDGNFHNITGLWIDNPDAAGLFASCTASSAIKDLGVARADVSITDGGGIIAASNAGNISRCYASGKAYGRYAGGLVGVNTGKISDCYTTVSISGTYIGGLVYTSSGTIERCYNAGSVAGSYDIAYRALLGEGCYHRDNGKPASGSDASDPGIELSEEEFTQQESFGFFDFNNVWTMAGDADYPYPELSGLPHIEMPDNTVEFAGGNGMPYDPYLISNAAHLSNVRDYSTKNFELLADIDLGGANWEPFTLYGNFEGNNNAISNGNIIAKNSGEGFFKSTSYSTVSNLGIENLNIVSEYNTPIGTCNTNVGLFAGALSYSRITNCYATGSINCVRGEQIGGFAGWSNSKIVDCHANADITGAEKIGGFIGYLYDQTNWGIPEGFCEVNSCYFTGKIKGQHGVGGFAGYTIGKVDISGCYSDGDVTGIEDVGGFIGLAYAGGIASNSCTFCNTGGYQTVGIFAGNSDPGFNYDNCYWYSDTAANTIGAGSTALISKINIPEIDEVDINAPVGQSALTTNFDFFGPPVSIEFLSTREPSVAMIDNGQLKGAALGNTEVDLLFTYAGSRTIRVSGYKTSVTGTPQLTVPATGITLGQSEIYMHAKNILTLTAAVLPQDATNKKLIWESDNESTVSVNSYGVITASQPGYATITATTEDGGYSASCEISVDTPTSVSITSGSSYCWPGDLRECKAKVMPSTAVQSVTWSSSDESVAIVGETNGMVRAIAPGTAMITATTVYGGLTATCYIYVKQHVTGIEVLPEGITIHAGELYSLLTVNVLPENAFTKSVSYSTSNWSVVKLDPNNKIVGNSPGRAVITVTTTDGGFTDTCIVTVVPAGTVIQPVTSVTLNSRSETVFHHDTLTFTADVLPEGATNSLVSWSSSDENVAIVDQSGKVTAVGIGTAVIKALAEGKSDTCNITVNPKPYTVTFNYSGAGSSVDVIVNEGAYIPKPDDPTGATGYTFGGWYTDEGFNDVWVFGSDTMPESNLTLYAKWDPITYTVTYEKNGGTGIMADSVFTYDKPACLTANGYLRTGYTFTGWAMSSDGTVYYADGASIINLADTDGAAITLYAIWALNNYCVTYDADGGVGAPTDPNVYHYNETVTVAGGTPERTGYTFGGWTSDAFPGQVFQAGNTFTMPAGSVTLTAKWSGITKIVTFDAGIGGSVYPSSKQVVYGETYGELPMPVRTGYYFYGWYTSKDGNGTLIEANDTVNLLDDIILYAKWATNSSVALSTPFLTAKSESYKSIVLTWKAVTGAKGYEVYKKIGSIYKKIATVDGALSYSDTELTKGVTYYYKIRAYRVPYLTAVYSSYSYYKYAKPAWPTVSLTAKTQTYTSISLDWNDIAGVDGYEIWRNTMSGGTYILIGYVHVSAYTDEKLTTGKTYYYKIRPFDETEGDTVYGPYCSYKYARPAWPALSLKAVSGGYDSIALDWNDIAGADKYQVYRNTSYSGTYTLIDTVTALDYIDENLITGKTYYYKIRPLDETESGPVYGPYSGYKYAKPAPSAPDIALLRTSATSINISWDAVEGASGYEVYRAASLNGTYTRVTATDGLSFENTGLYAGRTYYYKVRAYTMVGTAKVYGPYSVKMYL